MKTLSLLAVVVLLWVTAIQGLDVIKFTEDGSPALVVREGFVMPSFSFELSLSEQFSSSFVSSFFSSFFPRVYEERTQHSRFLVRHSAPVQVTNYGVIDGLGEVSRTDPALGVSASFKVVKGTSANNAKEEHTEQREEQPEQESFMYHLELDFQCATDYPVKRFVVIELSADDKSSPAGEKVAFIFTKRCLPPPPPARESLREPFSSSFYAVWSSAGGRSLWISSSDGNQEPSFVHARVPVLVMTVDEQPLTRAPPSNPALSGPDAASRVRHPVRPGNARTGAEVEPTSTNAWRQTLRSFFALPPLVEQSLMLIGMTTVLGLIGLLVVELVRGLASGEEDDEEHGRSEEGYEAVPLLSEDQLAPEQPVTESTASAPPADNPAKEVANESEAAKMPDATPAQTAELPAAQ